MLEEGIAGVRDIDMGLMLGTGMIPGPFAARRPARARRGPGRAGARRGRVGRALRAARDPAPARRAGTAGRRSRAGLLSVPPAGAGLRDGAGEARHARRRAPWCGWTNPPANSLGPARVEGLRQGVGRGSEGARGRWCSRRQSDAVLRGCRHQGVHAVGRRTRGARIWPHPGTRARVGAVRRSSRSPPSTGWRSAAGARSRWPATSGSPAARPPSASRRSTSGSSRASAAPSGCRGSSGRPRRWR